MLCGKRIVNNREHDLIFLTFSSIEDLELSPLIFTAEQLENRILEFIQKTDEVIKKNSALKEFSEEIVIYYIGRTCL
ncbi:hypothetical protein [Coxiella-like endosymbiont of Rhipicephalus sanguineus]|uniref:hypothetical protein n=1 Tax=Coxiella-like endosymbiont of Rhipicephalus sanguineus TaxID=1955402 RepID=UPI00203AA1D0|nr:hypothetical protein [Coxiella-like endosymbiont of Rhipicephalus sanguineus]